VIRRPRPYPFRSSLWSILPFLGDQYEIKYLPFWLFFRWSCGKFVVMLYVSALDVAEFRCWFSKCARFLHDKLWGLSRDQLINPSRLIVINLQLHLTIATQDNIAILPLQSDSSSLSRCVFERERNILFQYTKIDSTIRSILIDSEESQTSLVIIQQDPPRINGLRLSWFHMILPTYAELGMSSVYATILSYQWNRWYCRLFCFQCRTKPRSYSGSQIGETRLFSFSSSRRNLTITQ
jgi:hypothetical protein